MPAVPYEPPPRATGQQWRTIASLARYFEEPGSRQFAAKVLGRSIESVTDDGLTKREASRVITAAIKQQNHTGDAS